MQSKSTTTHSVSLVYPNFKDLNKLLARLHELYQGVKQYICHCACKKRKKSWYTIPAEFDQHFYNGDIIFIPCHVVLFPAIGQFLTLSILTCSSWNFVPFVSKNYHYTKNVYLQLLSLCNRQPFHFHFLYIFANFVQNDVHSPQSNSWGQVHNSKPLYGLFSAR